MIRLVDDLFGWVIRPLLAPIGAVAALIKGALLNAAPIVVGIGILFTAGFYITVILKLLA